VTWQPLLLLGLAGFLVGGVVAAYRNGARITAAVLAVLALALAAGGVLWLLPE
jgi:cell shape-determining protein MreD